MIGIESGDSPMEVAAKLIYSEDEYINRFTHTTGTRRTFEVEELKEIADYIYVYVSHHEPPESEDD